jgi:putative transcriptional regulator
MSYYCSGMLSGDAPKGEGMTTRFRLNEALDAAGMSQTDLHRTSGVAYSTINAIVHNKARQISLDTLDALSAALGCAPGDLLVREPEQSTPRSGSKPKGRK